MTQILTPNAFWTSNCTTQTTCPQGERKTGDKDKGRQGEKIALSPCLPVFLVSPCPYLCGPSVLPHLVCSRFITSPSAVKTRSANKSSSRPSSFIFRTPVGLKLADLFSPRS